MLRRLRSSSTQNRVDVRDQHFEGPHVTPAKRFRTVAAPLAVFALAAPLFAAASARALTHVGGVIASNESWGPAGNPYVLTDDVTVAEGVTLTLLPGVVVKADSAKRELIVLGRLTASATAVHPIVLTSYKDDAAHGDTNGDGSATRPAVGDWVGVGFAPSSPGGIGDFVEIRYAGYYGASGTNFSEDAGEVDARVRAACTSCHLFPEPGILPRELWRDQIVVMRDLVGSLAPESGGSSVGFSLREVAEWYQAQAPLNFQLPRSITRKGSGPIRFRKRELQLELGPGGGPAIATLGRLEPGEFGERDFFLSAVNMVDGSVHLISRSKGPLRIGSAGHPVRAIPGDVNGDGLTDLVISDLGDLALTDKEVGRVLVARQLPDGRFSIEPILTGVGRVADARPLDLDGDGDLDVIVAAFGWRRSGGIYLLRNQTAAGGRLAFRLEPILARAGAVSVVPIPAPSPNARPGFAVAFAQQYEVVSAFYPASRVAGENEARAGAGQGYDEHVLYRAPHPNWGISNLESVDLDGDSDLDFLLAHGDTLDDGFAFKPYQGVMWLENRGAGEFEPHRIGTLYGAHRAEAADFDGDGDLDVVAGGFLPQITQPLPKDHMRVESLIWFERTGAEWIPWSIEANHPRHTGVSVVDIDRDGRPDIVAAINNAWEIAEQEGGSALEVWFNRAARRR